MYEHMRHNLNVPKNAIDHGAIFYLSNIILLGSFEKSIFKIT